MVKTNTNGASSTTTTAASGSGFAFLFPVADTTNGVNEPTTSPTAGVRIALSALAEGTWTKVTGLAGGSFSLNCSFASDTITINDPGTWIFTLHVGGFKVMAGTRMYFFGFQVNGDDTDKAFGDITEFCFSEHNDQNYHVASGETELTLSAADTVKLFIMETHPSGTALRDYDMIHCVIKCWQTSSTS